MTAIDAMVDLTFETTAVGSPDSSGLPLLAEDGSDTIRTEAGISHMWKSCGNFLPFERYRGGLNTVWEKIKTHLRRTQF